MPKCRCVLLSLSFGLVACSASNVVDERPDVFSMDGFSVDVGSSELDAGAPPELDAGVDARLDAAAVDVGVDASDAGPAPSALAACLEAGGSFRIVDTIDNNDTRDHGPVLTFDVSAERQIAVSSADATLKFWTLDAFVGESGLAQLNYGIEVVATSVALDYWEELVVAGDSQGVIASWSSEGGMRSVVGGTTPGTALVSLSIDEDQGLLAQGDAEGMLLVRPLPGFEGETVQLEGVDAADLAWANGVLFVATPRGIEARDSQLNIIAHVLTGDPQLYVHADGNIVVAGGTQLRVFDTSLQPLRSEIFSFASLKSLTLVGGHPVGLFGGSGAPPYIEVQIQGAAGETANAIFAFESIGDQIRVPVQVVADPQGELLFVAFEDGGIELLSCEN